MDRILLIDGANSIWRACVKFGKVQADVPDEIIFTFNFFRNLRPLIEDISPDKCYFAMEGHPQFRYDLYPEYKANRRIIKQASDNFRQKNVERFQKTSDIVLLLLKFLPITLVRAARYEADDVIATLVDNMRDENITILSSDGDFVQLLQMGFQNLRIYNPIKKVDMEAPPYSALCYKILQGDKSDNIPALLSPKKAIAAASNPEILKKFMEVEENRANFNINKQLIEFQKVPLEELEITEGIRNFQCLKQFFIDMKFESIVNDQSWSKYIKTFDCLKY